MPGGELMSISVYTVLTIELVAFATGLVAFGFAGRFYPSGKRAFVLCLVPLLALVLMQMFC
jgi:hypothetical protein